MNCEPLVILMVWNLKIEAVVTFGYDMNEYIDKYKRLMTEFGMNLEGECMNCETWWRYELWLDPHVLV